MNTIDWLLDADPSVGSPVESKRDPDGGWPLEHVHDDNVVIPMEELGRPSRWITLRATRMLRWARSSP